MMLPKNLTLLLRKMVSWVGAFLVLSGIVSVYLDQISIFISMALGMSFSFLVFVQLVYSQVRILGQRKKGVFFFYYLIRLFLYGVLIGISFLLKDYLNLIIILVCLFTFQVMYVVLEFKTNLKKYRKRQENGRIRKSNA